MTVHQPSTGIVGKEPDHKPAASWEHRNILAGWIGIIECCRVTKDPLSLPHEIKIMTMKMDATAVKI
jgi:hypothetical protein